MTLAAANGRRYNVPVAWIRQTLNAVNQWRVVGYQTVFNGIIHLLCCTVEPFPCEVGTIRQKVAYPFVMDVPAPACAKAAGAGQPHQQVADVRGV